MKSDLPIVAFCEAGGSVALPSAAKLSDIVPDLGSWIGFLKMVAGGPAAPMVACSTDGRIKQKMRVIHRARVTDQNDSYDALDR